MSDLRNDQLPFLAPPIFQPFRPALRLRKAGLRSPSIVIERFE